MSILKYIDRIERMDYLIRKQATGTPSEFAKRMTISRSTLMENIKELKIIGAPIKYNKFRETYYYEYNCKLNFSFERFER